MTRGLKFRIKKKAGSYYMYLCSENKGAYQLRGYSESDLRLCFRICKCWLSHDAALTIDGLSSCGKSRSGLVAAKANLSHLWALMSFRSISIN